MNEEQLAMRARLAKSLRPQLDGCIGYYILMLEKICESPIEIAFGASLMAADHLEHANMQLGLMLSGASEMHVYRDDLALLIPQYPWQGYRIDFALRLPRYRFKYLFIECDGHDFHERTKEQAARDRSKDRAIQEAGFPVLRFTGSEIYRDSGSCAAQVIAFISNRFEDYLPRT